MLLYTHAVWGLALHDFFGPDGWISRDLVDVSDGQTQSISPIPSGGWCRAGWIWPAYAVMMVILALFTVGFVDARHVALVALGRDFVRQSRSRSSVRPG